MPIVLHPQISADLRPCSTYFLKKNAYKLIHMVQTHIVQGSTVFSYKEFHINIWYDGRYSVQHGKIILYPIVEVAKRVDLKHLIKKHFFGCSILYDIYFALIVFCH